MTTVDTATATAPHMVWVAATRKGIASHRPWEAGLTVCHRSMRTGELISPRHAGELNAVACDQCFPATPTTTTTTETPGPTGAAHSPPADPGTNDRPVDQEAASASTQSAHDPRADGESPTGFAAGGAGATLTNSGKDVMSGHQPIGTFEVHPVADLFPMLAADELAELAADIKQRGLLQPIVLDAPAADPKALLLDGRNRLAACATAGVQPTFAVYDGTDPVGFILALNINRRHMTKGQQAMVAARALLVSNTSAVSASNSTGINRTRIAQAVTVRDHAPDLADAVISGATGLDEAYKVARQRKTEADSVENQLARLRDEDPELADRVVEGELSLAGAQAEARARAAARESERRTAIANLKSVLTYLTSASITPAELAARDYAAAVDDFKPDDLDYAAATMAAVAALRER